MENNIKVIKDLGFAFRRSNANPVDISEVWESLNDAIEYAKGNRPEKGAPYSGQIISVKEGGENKAYIIQDDKTLTPIGSGGGGGTLTEVISDTPNMLKSEVVENKVHISFLGIENGQMELT